LGFLLLLLLVLQGNGGQLSTDLVVDLDAIKGFAYHVFTDQVFSSTHILPFVFDAEKWVISKF